MVGLFLCAATAVCAQTPRKSLPIETSLGFDWVVANTPPGRCQCFSLTGISESVAVNLDPHWAIVGEGGVVWQSNVRQRQLGLDFSRVLAGGRYRWHPEHRVSWFGQVLIGMAHQSGTGYPRAASWALEPGGGLDVALSRHVLFRPFEIDYLRTAFPNGAGNVQNNFRYGVSLVFRFQLPE